MNEDLDAQLKRLVDRSLIQDVVLRYARGIDRRDWELVRSAFHHDSFEEHGEYTGNVDGFIQWVSARHAQVLTSTHFIGNCLIDFLGRDVAFVETYFASHRVGPPSDEGTQASAILVEGFGRYLDRFDRRQGEWRVARRLMVYDEKFTTTVQTRARVAPFVWGVRDRGDPVFRQREEALKVARALESSGANR
jgi:SnoaL-like domain